MWAKTKGKARSGTTTTKTVDGRKYETLNDTFHLKWSVLAETSALKRLTLRRFEGQVSSGD
jgi:hypothetical protein